MLDPLIFSHPRASRNNLSISGQGGCTSLCSSIGASLIVAFVTLRPGSRTRTVFPLILISVDTSWLRDASSFSVTQLSVCVTWIEVMLCAETCGISASRTSSSVMRPLGVRKLSVSGRFNLFMVGWSRNVALFGNNSWITQSTCQCVSHLDQTGWQELTLPGDNEKVTKCHNGWPGNWSKMYKITPTTYIYVFTQHSLYSWSPYTAVRRRYTLKMVYNSPKIILFYQEIQNVNNSLRMLSPPLFRKSDNYLIGLISLLFTCASNNV